MNLTVKCPSCNGSGRVKCGSCDGTRKVKCPTCHGDGLGVVKCDHCDNGYTIDPDDDERMKCSFCNGEGVLHKGICKTCDGMKQVNCPNCSDGNVGCKKCEGKGTLSVFDLINDPEVFNRKTGEVSAENRNAYAAESVLIELANEGNADAAWILAKEPDRPEDEELGGYVGKYVRQGAELGSIFALTRLGSEEVFGGNPAGVSKLVDASEKGCATACGLLAVVYHLGLAGVVKDDEAAVRYCEMAKDNGWNIDSYYYGLKSFAQSLPAALGGDIQAMCGVEDYLRINKRSFGSAGADACVKWRLKILRSETHKAYLSCLKNSKYKLSKETIAKYEEAISLGDRDAMFEFGSILAYDKKYLPAEYISSVFGNDELRMECRGLELQVMAEAESSKTSAGSAHKKKSKQGSAHCASNPQRGDSEKSTKLEPKKEGVRTVTKSSRGSAQKKRWKFITLGLLLGWMGAHYLYARRWGLFALHIAAFIGLLIAPPLGLLWLATWLGGTFFVKKDGSKGLML